MYISRDYSRDELRYFVSSPRMSDESAAIPIVTSLFESSSRMSPILLKYEKSETATTAPLRQRNDLIRLNTFIKIYLSNKCCSRKAIRDSIFPFHSPRDIPRYNVEHNAETSVMMSQFRAESIDRRMFSMLSSSRECSHVSQSKDFGVIESAQ